jgi:hypothetical protein
MEESTVNWFHRNYKHKEWQRESNLSKPTVTDHLLKNKGMLQLWKFLITAFSLHNYVLNPRQFNLLKPSGSFTYDQV